MMAVEELLSEHRLALLQQENTGKLLLASIFGMLAYSASSKWTPFTIDNYCIAIVCVRTLVQPDTSAFNRATRLQLLSPLLYPRIAAIQSPLVCIQGYYQASPHAPSYEVRGGANVH